MIGDPKERAEHVMLVDLGRNDLGRVCDYGTVKVSEMMVIGKFCSHVMRIVQSRSRHAAENMDATRWYVLPSPLAHSPAHRKSARWGMLRSGVRRGVMAALMGYSLAATPDLHRHSHAGHAW
ncbi:MAG: chorismate-binding protein [Anaerolineae bacterium]